MPSTSIAVVDSTVQLEWEITKETFDACEFDQFFTSPVFKVKVDKQESKWKLIMYPMGDKEKYGNKVQIYLKNYGTESMMVKFDFTILTQN